MEEIEYLEEYEDLVLPALNSAAAAAATSSALQNQKINNEGDDSSSSLDQDIFNCLFDDNSDDEDFNEHQKGDTESALRPKTGFPESFDDLDDNIEELAEKVIQKVEISRQDQASNFSNIDRTENKITSSTPKYKTCMTKTSGTTIPLSTVRQEPAFTNKSKSIATVRPTVQSQQQQQQQKKSNLLPRPTSSFVPGQNPSTSSSSFSKNPAPSLTIKKSTTTALTGVNKRPATIVRPEKIITKDPANDPLDLDEFSEAGSDNSSFSDISGETYNSFSDFVDDDSNDEFYSGDDDYYDGEDDEAGVSSSSQVIEISNDSSGAPSNLEDLRASTPSPVISDDSDTPSSSFGFKTKKSKFIKPYSHPDIIISVLRKGTKPLLLELLHTYNLLEDSVEDNEGDNIVIDITKSSENLVESLDTQQVATSLKDTLPLPAPTAKISLDPVDLNLTENDRSITADLINKNPTTHSKKTNKNKSKKKSITNMDYRNLKSSGSISADSDLSEVEELLEESYAEAMKRVKDENFSGQELGAEIEIGEEQEVTATQQNKQKLPKAGVVIDYDDIQIDEPVEVNKNEEPETEKMERRDLGQKEKPTQEVDSKNAKTLFENVEIKDKEYNIHSEPKECLQQKDIMEENAACKNENTTDKASKESNNECQKVTESTKISDNVKSCDSPNARKKKRFRNLITPEPTEGSSEAGKSIDDIKDFKGFEEVRPVKIIEKIEMKKENPTRAEETQEKVQKIEHTEKKDRPPESFKSPSSTHQSLKDKAKEVKDKNSSDNSKEAKDKSLTSFKSKSFKDGSKDRSSTESSRENSSRESSKDRSRESSKDRSKHSHDKDSTTKHHHKDHRKSSDSQESSRSRESSKSRDSKETKYTKTDSKDSNKSTIVKIQKPPEGSKEKSTEKKDVKTLKGNEKGEKDIGKTSIETKSNKDHDNKKDLKEHKSSLEKDDKKPAETPYKPKEKDSSKSLPPPSKEHKQKEHTDVRKSSSFSTKSESNTSSRDSSKERKNINKPLDSPKSLSETKKFEYQKTPKVSTDTNKSVTHKPSSSIPAVNVKSSSTSDKPKEIPKSSQDSKNADKNLKKSPDPANENKSFKPITKSATDSNLIVKNTPVKKAIQSPATSKIMKTSSTDLNTSKSSFKSNEADKKDPQKLVKMSSSDSKNAFKTEDQNKKDKSDIYKSVNDKGQLNKLPDHSNKTKTQTPIKNMPKKTIGTSSSIKRKEGSTTKPGNLETKDTSAIKSVSENMQKIKTVQSDEMKSNEKSPDFKKPPETSKNTTASGRSKPVESLSKDTKTTPKEVIIKKTEETNTNESVKVKKQEESKSLDIATPQMSEKTKSSAIKIEEKANELEKTKPDSNKGNDFKQTADLITGLGESQNNTEKKQVKSRIDIKETKTETTSQTKEKQLDETQDGADTKKAKVNKDELKEKNSKTEQEKSRDKETEKKDDANDATLQANSEKPKLLPTSGNKQNDKPPEVESKTPDNSNNSLMANEETQTTANKEQSENKQDKAGPRKSENPSDLSRTKEKTQATANNEQKGKKQEKADSRTRENSNDSVTVGEKEKTQSTANKEQQEKPQEKAKPRKSENPKGKTPTTTNNKPNEKNQKKIEPRTRENSNDSVTVKVKTQATTNTEQQEKPQEKVEPRKSENRNDPSTTKEKTPTTNNKHNEKNQEKIEPRTRENSNDSVTIEEKTRAITNKEQQEKPQEKVEPRKSENPNDPSTTKGKTLTTNNKQNEKNQEKIEQRARENSNDSLTVKTISNNEQKEKKNEKAQPTKSDNPNNPSTAKGKSQTTTSSEQKKKKQEIDAPQQSEIPPTTKEKTQPVINNEQKKKKLLKENSNDSLTAKEKTQSTTNKEQNEKKQEKAAPGKSVDLSDPSTTKGKIQTATNNKQQENKQEKAEHRKSENPNVLSTPKRKTQTTIKNEQKDKIQEKAEPRKSEHPSVLSTPKGKTQTTTNNQKEKKQSELRKSENPGDPTTIRGKAQTSTKNDQKEEIQEIAAPREIENPNDSLTTKGKTQTTVKSEENEKKQEKAEPKKSENPNDSLTTKGRSQTPAKTEEQNKKQAKVEPRKSEKPTDPSMSKAKTQTSAKNEQKQKISEKAEPKKMENPNDSLTIKGKTQTTVKIEEKEKKQEKAEPRKSANPNVLSTPKGKSQTTANNEQKEKKQEKPDPRKIENPNPNDSLTTKDKIQTTAKSEENNKKPANAEPRKSENPSGPSTSKGKTQTFTKIEQKEKKQEKTESRKSENPNDSLAAKGKIQTTMKSEQEEKIPEKAESRKNEFPKDSSTTKGKPEMATNIDKVKESNITEKALVSTAKSVSSPKTAKKPQKQTATTSEDKTNPTKSVNTFKHTIKSQDASQETNKKDISSIQTKEKLDVKKEMETCLKSKIDPAQLQSELKEEKLKIDVVEKGKQEPTETSVCKVNIVVDKTKLNSSKSDKQPVSQEKAESRKTKNLIENKLHKSAVVVIEPLTFNQPVDKNLKGGIANKSRITRSRNDNTKLNDSITKEKDFVKEKMSENTENLTVSERKDKSESEEPNQELISTRKNSDVKMEPGKSESNTTKGGDKELSNVCQINVSKEELKSPEDKIETADSSKREIGEEGFKNEIEKAKEEHFKSELEMKTEREKNKIAKVELSEGKDLDKKETGDNFTIGKTSSDKEIAETHREQSAVDIKGENEKEKLEISHVEIWNKKTVPKLETTKTKESEESNKDEEKEKKDTTIEITSIPEVAEHCKSIKTKSSDLKGEVGKEKSEILQITTSEEQSIKAKSCNLEEGAAVKKKTENLHIEPSEGKSTQKEAVEYNQSLKTKIRGNIEKAEKQQIETLQVESSGEKTTVLKEADDDFGPKKTRSRGGLKENVEKGKSETPDIDSSNKNPSTGKESEEHFDPIKTRSRVELKEEPGKEKMEKLQKDSPEEHFEPRKTRSRGEHKEELGKEKMEKPQIESPHESTSAPKETEEHFEPRKTRSRVELKEDAGNEKTHIKSSDEKPTTQKEPEEKIESIKTERRSDLKVEIGKRKRDISQTELSDEKTATEKDSEEHTEPIKTRRRVEHEKEAGKGKQDSLKVESSDEKTATQKEVKTNLKPTKTKSCRDLNEEAKKEKSESSQVESSEEKNTTHIETETIKNRSRDNLKDEVGKGKAKTLQIESFDEKLSAQKECEEHFEPRKTRSRVDLKIDAGNEKVEKTQIESSVGKTTQKEVEDHFEPIKTRSRCDSTVEAAGKEKNEKSQIRLSDEKNTIQKDLEDNLEPIKTRRRGDLKPEAEREKSEKHHYKSFDEKRSETTIKTRKDGDHKGESVKGKKEILQTESAIEKLFVQKKAEEINLESTKTRKRGDVKEETEKEKIELLEEKSCKEKEKNLEPITKRNEDMKAGAEKDNNELSDIESSKEKILVQEVVLFEPRKTRNSREPKAEAEKTKDEISQGSLSQSRVEQQNSSVSKNSKEEEDKSVKTRNREDFVIDSKKELIETSKDDSLNQAAEQHSEPAKEDESKISENEKIVSTSDEKQADKMTVTSDDDNTKEKTKDLANSEIIKSSQESLSSETEMSGGESSIISSNSDGTLRRTLRKRGTESPFPENDNIKKTFKGPPPLKSATQLTPKSAKIEKSAANVLNVSSKRHLRSPAFHTESPISTKKTKLETPRKTTTRFRNLHDDCLEEKELPIITSEFSDISKERREEPEIINESLKQSTSTNTKEVKDSSKITAVSERKEKTTLPKTPQTSVNVPQKEVLVKEVTKERASKEDLKTSLRSEEIKSKQDKSEQSTKIPETPIQSKTIKSKVNTTPNKSAECAAVISFSDWLKAKNSNTTAEINEECIPSAAKESTPNTSKRQSKIKAKIVESKPTENKDKTDEVAKTASHEETIMICQNKKIETVLEEKQSSIEKDQTTVTSESMENMNATEKLDKSLLEPSENQSQNALKQRKGKTKNKSGNAKQQRVTTNKVSKKSPRTQTSPTITPPRVKRSETDLLIEAMSKEMKDGGITDLLRAETHVKRQRLSIKRKTNSDNAEQLKSSASTTTRETTLAAAVAQIPNAYTPGLTLNKEMPKVLDFSENLELITSKDIMKSPTRRKIPQTIEKSQKVAAKPNDEPKVFATKSRKSYNVKELTWQVDKDNIDFATAGSVTSRRSMPILTRESPATETYSLSSRKQVGSSTLLNVIPNAQKIKTLYSEDKKRPDSRNKIHQTENLLKRFKCRKLRIHLDRSIVQKYWQSINKRDKQVLKATSSQTVLKNVLASMPTIPAADAVPIIQNNSETSLRIESVIDASTILNTKSAAVLKNTQGSLVLPNVIPSSVSLQDSVNTSIIQQRQQQQQQPTFILPNIADNGTALNTALVNVSDANEIIELKNEFMDESPAGLINDAIPPDTSNLLARAQSITEAAQHALSNSVTPTDIRLLSVDSSENNFVPSFGVAPTVLDNKGTCMYTFLHPAKYNRNHSNVLLDYCCPNLNGPMPAIDPTRIHAQVQVPIIELPASIVLTTKVVTKADLENENSSIPSIIRKKAEKIRKNMATHHKLATITTSATSTQSIPTPIVPAMTQPLVAPTQRPTLPATINALTKQLPATTTITAKIRPPLPQESTNLINQPPPNLVSSVASTFPKHTIVSVIPKGHFAQLSNVQNSSLRSNLRRFDVLLKQLVHPYETLNFVERHRIIEAVITSGKLMPKDLEQTLVLMEEYIKQTLIIKNDSPNQPLAPPTPAILSTNNYATSQTPAASTSVTAQMPQLQPSPKILASSAATGTANSYSKQFEQSINKSIRKVQQSGSKNTNLTTNAGGATATEALMKQHQVPIYDTDRNIIGYQMRMMTPMSSMPAYTKSTMSTHTGAIMSTSLDTSNNRITSYRVNKRAVKRPAQDSPRVFYTTPPLKTSTPKAITDSHMHPTQQAKNAKTITQKTQGSIGLSSSASSETITTTTTATVKRVTRSTATGSKLIIVSKSNQSSEETILPDANSSQQQTEQTEIKNEKDIEGFLG